MKKENKIMKWIKNWFTIIEVMIATFMLATFTYIWLNILSGYTTSIENQEKTVYAQRIAANYMEAIEHIRTSAWIDSSVNPWNDVNWRVNFDRCWWDLKSLIKTDSVTPDLMWWFCKEIPGWTWKSFSELEWTYTLKNVKDQRTWEKKYELSKVTWEWNPWNIENYDSYSTFFKVKWQSKLEWKFNEFIDYSNRDLMEKRFNWEELEINRYSKYFNNNMNIPWRTILVTIEFKNATDEDVKQFKESEKDYYKKQIKKAVVKVEFWNANNKRTTYVVERIFTNFKSSN